jgi:hypothetical protein
MSLREQTIEPDPRLIVIEPRWRRMKAPVRRVLQYGLRTVFALMLLICVALTVAYYTHFRTRRALAGPRLHLHADNTVSLSRKADRPLADESLAGVLERAMKRYRAAAGETGDEVKRADWASWQNPYGPPVTVVAHPRSTHAALDSLLHTCVDHGFESYVLADASDREYSFSFVLVEDLPRGGLPDPCLLPPMALHLRAAEDGSLLSLRVNQRKLRSLAELRRLMIHILGPERGPRSIQADAEVEMRCDANLKIRHVFEAQKAIAGYKTKDGTWVSLNQRVRPVHWGTGAFEEIEMVEIEYEDVRDSDASDKVNPDRP